MYARMVHGMPKKKKKKKKGLRNFLTSSSWSLIFSSGCVYRELLSGEPFSSFTIRSGKMAWEVGHVKTIITLFTHHASNNKKGPTKCACVLYCGVCNHVLQNALLGHQGSSKHMKVTKEEEGWGRGGGGWGI